MITGSFFLDNGNQISLGRRIGKGGEGEVYLVEGVPNKAIKLYTFKAQEKLIKREEKIRAMIEAQLGGSVGPVAFPTAAVSDRRGDFRGFVMDAVSNHRVFHELYGPASRKHSFPNADYKFLVRVATNIARCVANVHEAGCVIGDVNHSGILVSEKATVALIDADSFQFTWNSIVHRCEYGVPEYTPPELQGRKFSEVDRSKNHDCFGLAVVIFQLLMMGRHPFSGTPRRGEMLSLQDAIQKRKYPYSETTDVGLDQPPGTPAISELSQPVARLFDAAFVSAPPIERPSAQDWVAALEQFEGELARCKKNPMHFTSPPVDECPWCEMESLANVILFIPPLSLTGGKAFLKATTLDLDGIIAKLNFLTLPPREKILPKISVYTSAGNRTKKSTGVINGLLKALVVAAFVVLIIVAPDFWFVWGLISYFVYRAIEDDDRCNKNELESYKSVASQWGAALLGWQRKIGVDSFLSKKAEVETWIRELKTLSSQKQNEIQSIQKNRRNSQLNAFLDGFEIRRAKIKGIGRARLAYLISYGIETAADVERARLLSVPGFGEATCKPLLEWKMSLEKRFVFNSSNNPVDRGEIFRIEQKYRVRSDSLEKNIRQSIEYLVRLHQQIYVESGRVDPDVENAYRALEAKKVELRDLNIQIPVTTIAWPQPSKPSANTGTAASTISPPPSTRKTLPNVGSVSIPGCPRCGSTMVRRTARRGKNAGSTFWGCSRYPTCRGTRN